MTEYEKKDVDLLMKIAKIQTDTPMGAFKLLQETSKLLFADRCRELR